MKKSLRLTLQTLLIVCSLSAFYYINFSQTIGEKASFTTSQTHNSDARVVLLPDVELLQNLGGQLSKTFRLVLYAL